MTDRDRAYSRRILASLVAVLMVTSVLGAAGTVAAAPGVSISHQNGQVTVQPGDTVQITATFEQTDANSPAMEPQLPSGWTITATTAGTDWAYVDQQGTFLGSLALSDGDGVTGTYTHTYTVQVPNDASSGDYTIGSEGSVIEPASGNRLVDTASTTATVEDTGTDNTPPTVDAIADQTVTEGDSATVSVSTSDADGDSVSLSLSQSPAFVTLSNGEITVAPQSGDAGTYTVEVVADDGTDTTTESFQVTVEEPATGGGDVVFAVNAGGSAYTATDGTTFVADTNFVGGTTFTSGEAGTPSEPEIANTDDDEMYWTERYGDFDYNIPVAENGQYEVTLYFAELYQGVANDGGEGDRVFDVSVEAEGQPILDNYDIIAETGAPHTAISETATVDVSDGELNLAFSTVEDNAKVSAIKVEKVGDTAPATGSALVEILPDSGTVDASTYGTGSYQVTNTGEKEIVSVSFDLSTATLPDMVFDPQGTAGDPTGEGLNIVDEGGTGITTAEGGSEAFSQPHNGQNADDGYDVMTVAFDDFQSGETATFWADNDPTSIKGATVGSQEAGPVSGLELARSTVTVEYADGTTQTTQLMGDGSLGGSTAVTGDEAPAPTIGAQGVSLDANVLDDYHSGATVSSADQTITVSGEPGETVTLVRVEGELSLSNVPNGGYDVEDLEANNAVDVEYYTATLDSNGEATVPVTLTDSPDDDDAAGYNYFVAAQGQASGDMGLASNVVVLEYDPTAANTPPTIDAIADQTVTEGGSATVPVSASDADGDAVSLSVNGPAFVTLSSGEITVAPQSGDAGTYDVTVTADDGTDQTTETFQVTVEEADSGIPPIGDFENAPTDPDGDGVYEDVNGDGSVNVNDAQALFANLDDPVVQSDSNTEFFDFNDDGSVNVNDAQALFNDLTGGS
jgi:hypothetical protein